MTCSIKDVLMGYQAGRQATGLQLRIEQTKSEKERDSMQAYLNCMEAGRRWQKTSIPNSTSAQLIVDYNLLQAEGYVDDVPMECRLRYTQKFAEDKLSEGRYSEWAALVALAGDDDAEWLVSSPKFSCFDMDEPTAQNFAYFAQCWYGCVFSDDWLSKFIHATDSKVEAQSFQQCCETFLDAFVPTLDQLSEDMRQLSAAAVSIMRGLLALLDPEPFPHGASMKDVDFLTQAKGRGKDPNRSILDIEGLDPNTGKCICRNLSRSGVSGGWPSLLSAYEKASGAEAAHGRQLLDLRRDMEAVKVTPADPDPLAGEHADVRATVEKQRVLNETFAQKVPCMQRALRPGATTKVESILLDWSNAYISRVGRMTAAEGAEEAVFRLGKSFQEALKVVTIDGGAQARHKMNDLAMAAQETYSIGSLQRAVLKKFSERDHLSELKDALAATANVKKPQEVADHMHGAAELIVARQCEVLMGSARADKASRESMEVETQECLSVLRLLLKESCICMSMTPAAGVAWKKNIESFITVVETLQKLCEQHADLSKIMEEKGDAAGADLLPQLLEHLDFVNNNMYETMTLTGVPGSWMERVARHFEKDKAKITQDLESLASSMMELHSQTLRDQTTSLLAIVGGGPQNPETEQATLWFDGWQRDEAQPLKKQVLQYFAETLDRADVQKIETCTTAAVGTLQLIEALGASVTKVGFEVRAEADVIKRGQEACRRAHITKLECLLARVFGKSWWKADKVKKALTKYLKSIPQECIDNLGLGMAITPSTDIMPELWQLVDEATQ